MVINAVGHLAEAAWHHPDIAASYAWVEVKLQNHSAKGITDKDFELARKIEDFVSWRPGKEGGALEGTPSRRSAVRLYQVRRQVSLQSLRANQISGSNSGERWTSCDPRHGSLNRRVWSKYSYTLYNSRN